MAKYRGSKGNLAIGGVVVGSPLVQGAVEAAATSATFDATSLKGVIRPGDTFTVAGDDQEYTIVTGGVIGASTANEIDVTFTPPVQEEEGWADNAAVTFASNSMANIRSWEAEIERPYIEGTVMGENGQTGTLDVPRLRGRCTAWLDYGDEKQAAVLDQLKANTDPTALALTLVTASGKHFWCDALCTRGTLGAQMGALQQVQLEFMSEGALDSSWDWN